MRIAEGPSDMPFPNRAGPVNPAMLSGTSGHTERRGANASQTLRMVSGCRGGSPYVASTESVL